MFAAFKTVVEAACVKKQQHLISYIHTSFDFKCPWLLNATDLFESVHSKHNHRVCFGEGTATVTCKMDKTNICSDT